MKKFFIILASLLIIGYLIFSAIYFNSSSKDEVCNKFEVVVKDSLHTQFIHQKDIEVLLKRKKVYPVGKTMD